MPDKTHDNGPHDHGAGQDLLRHSEPRNLKTIGIVVLVAALGVAGFGIASRIIADNRVENWTGDQAVQSVQVLTLESSKKGTTLALPGEVQAFINAPIYAQVTGYVKKWYVDIGAAVKQGQLLAELNTPELDGQLQQAQANLDAAQTRLTRRRQLSPVTGSVEEVYYRPGETVQPGKPVIALLPPANLKVRFFSPERQLATIQIGDIVGISCDSCPTGLTAKVTFIARSAEYTPPVIYSLEERAKLVYLIEARPDDPSKLRVGQPVTVTREARP